MDKKPIRKAVILAAWYGTRFLPATKSVPKEMFPVLDKPIMQYAVEELVQAGIEQIVFVTSSRKKAVEDYFDTDFELEQRLEMAWKDRIKSQIVDVTTMAQFVYVRQKQPKWTWDAILLTKNIIGDEPFMLFFGDDFISARPSRAQQLLETYDRYPWIVLSWMYTEKPEDANRYWFVAWVEIEPTIIEVDTVIEKPWIEKKPSNTAVVSWYILTPHIFNALQEAVESIGDTREIHYIDWIRILQQRWETKVYTKIIENGRYYDCGNVLEYVKTNIEMWLKRDDIQDDLKRYLKELVVTGL